MNLMKFKGADDAVKLTIRLSAGYCIILTIAFASSIIFLINKIEKAYGQALVIDRRQFFQLECHAFLSEVRVACVGRLCVMRYRSLDRKSVV